MACLDHNCIVCGWWDASNEPVHVCPECGGRVHTTFDETPTQSQRWREAEEAEYEPEDEEDEGDEDEFDEEDFDLTDDEEDEGDE